jgi:predicted hotdog family 3-hydroxylacyl-ACP dehydratase
MHKMDLPSLLPHRPPMLFIDEIISHEGAEIMCGITVGAIPNEGMNIAFAIEYLGQASAILGGLTAADVGGEKKPGFLLSIKSFTALTTHFSPGQNLLARVRLLDRNSALSTFEGELLARKTEVLLVQSSFTVYHPELL